MGVLGSGLTGLGNVPTASEPGSGPNGGAGGGGGANCAGADWFGQCGNVFQQRSGLLGFQWSTIVANDFADTNKPLPANNAGQGFQLSGVGAPTSTYTNLPGGVVKVVGPNAGPGQFADWTSNGGTGWTTIGNIRLKRFMVAYRLAIGSAPAAASRFSAGIFSASTFIGIGYATNATNWQAGRGATPLATSLLDTGVPIGVDATGNTQYISFAMGNFDLTHWAVMPNLVTSTVPTNVELLTNLPSNTAEMYLANEGTDALIYYIDKAWCGIELV